MTIRRTTSYLHCAAAIVALLVVPTSTFSPGPISSPSPSGSSVSTRSSTFNKGKRWSSMALGGSMYSPGRASSARSGGKDRSKRQFRVGQLVQTELGRILHSGVIKGDVDYMEDELRQRISIVSVDVSPDLRQARVTVSVRKSTTTTGREENPVVDQRRAYSWLVENTKAIRHTLAQKMSHMKNSPSLTFVQVDVGAAVDVMYLIDKVSSGYERERIGQVGEDDSILSKDFFDGFDDEWDEEDDEFFEDSS